MGYSMRYISVDEHEISLAVLENIFKQSDAAYSFVDIQPQPRESATLTYHHEPYGAIEINKPGDGLFEDELHDLKEFLEDIDGMGKKAVVQVLANAKAIVAVQVLFQGRKPEETLGRIDPLWQWLFDNREGLLQVDGEGYYDGTQLIL